MSGAYTRVTERGQRDERAAGDVAVDDEVGADAVDRRRAERADETEGDEEHPAVHRRLDPDVAHPRGPRREQHRLVVGRPNSLTSCAPDDVEPLGHLRVHLGVGVHVLPGERLQPLADALGGDDEQRQHDQRQQRQPPLEREHRDQAW